MTVGQTYRIDNFDWDAVVTYESRTNDWRDATISVRTVSVNPICGGATRGIFTLEINTDNYGGETGWEMKELSTGRVIDRSPMWTYASRETYIINFVDQSSLCYDVDYVFTITDANQDGMCRDGTGCEGFKGIMDGKETK